MYKGSYPEGLPVNTGLLRFIRQDKKTDGALTETMTILWLNEYSVYKQGETGMYQRIIMPVDVLKWS